MVGSGCEQGMSVSPMSDVTDEREQIIVTSYLFPEGNFDLPRLQRLSKQVGKERLVVDVRYVFTLLSLRKLKSSSCRRKSEKWIVAMNRWQLLTDMEVNKGQLDDVIRVLAR